MLVDDPTGCGNGCDDKAPVAAPSVQRAKRASAQKQYSLCLGRSSQTSSDHQQSNRARGELPDHSPFFVGAGDDRPCSRAATDPARWSKGPPANTVFPPRPPTGLPPASWGGAYVAIADRPRATGVLDAQRHGEDADGVVSWRWRADALAHADAGLDPGVSEDSLARIPASFCNQPVGGDGWSKEEVSLRGGVSRSTGPGGHAPDGSEGGKNRDSSSAQPALSVAIGSSGAWSSPSSAAGAYSASRLDQGAVSEDPLRPSGSGGNGSFYARGWFGDAEDESRRRVPASATKTADDAAIIGARLERMDMSNTFDSEAVRPRGSEKSVVSCSGPGMGGGVT